MNYISFLSGMGVGLFVYTIFMMFVVSYLTRTTRDQRTRLDETVDLMRDRNSIAEQQRQYLAVIAIHLKVIALRNGGVQSGLETAQEVSKRHGLST